MHINIYLPTCTIPSSPHQGLAPCLVLASRFPPADDNDRNHVDNGSDEDDYHDESLMLLRGIYILSNYMAGHDHDIRNAKKKLDKYDDRDDDALTRISPASRGHPQGWFSGKEGHTVSAMSSIIGHSCTTMASNS